MFELTWIEGIAPWNEAEKDKCWIGTGGFESCWEPPAPGGTGICGKHLAELREATRSL